MMAKYFNSQDALNLINNYDFAIFPIHGTKEDGSCTCNNTNCQNIGKHPATPDGFKSASKDIERVSKLWAGRKGLNVGVSTGKPSNMFVIDIDSEEGEIALNNMGHIPNTLTVKTGKGKHLFFKYPGKEVVTKRGIINGVDVRGDGGYVAGVGSIHSSGHVYEFINPLEEISEAPDFIIDLVLKEKQKSLNIMPAPTLNIYTNDKWSLDDVRKHLSFINPDCGYDEWIKVGMALQQEGVPFYVFDEWSKRGSKYDGTTNQHWKSFNSQGGVTYGTVVAYAKQGGWKPSNAVTHTAIPQKIEIVNPETGEIEEVVREKKGMYLIQAKDMKYSPDENDFVQGLLENGAMSVVYGESNCGKTFFMADLAYHIAEGKRWRDKRVEAGKVIYVPLEGTKGLTGRVEAYRRENQTNIDGFNIMPCGFDFLDAEGDVTEFIELLQIEKQNGSDIKIIIIDTLARAIGGGDENSGQDMGLLVKHADAIRSVTGAHICFIHHSGKDKARGARGHSSLRAAVDTEIEVSREEGDDFSSVKIVKQREMEMGDDMFFQLKSVTLGVNKYNEEKTSCVVEACQERIKTRKVSLTPVQQFIYDGLVDAILTYGCVKNINKDMPPVKCVSYDDLKDVLEERGYKEIMETENKTSEQQIKSATQSARMALKNKGKINFNRKYIWVNKDNLYDEE